MADILIIDDEKAIRKTLSEILSFEGYKIDEASDGEEGLKKFKDKAYDVVLCDIKMPSGLKGSGHYSGVRKFGWCYRSPSCLFYIIQGGSVVGCHYPNSTGVKFFRVYCSK